MEKSVQCQCPGLGLCPWCAQTHLSNLHGSEKAVDGHFEKLLNTHSDDSDDSDERIVDTSIFLIVCGTDDIYMLQPDAWLCWALIESLTFPQVKIVKGFAARCGVEPMSRWWKVSWELRNSPHWIPTGLLALVWAGVVPIREARRLTEEWAQYD